MSLRLSRWRISGPCWWITPFGALVDPDVCTMTMRSSGGDVVLDRVEQRVGSRAVGERLERRRSRVEPHVAEVRCDAWSARPSPTRPTASSSAVT